MAAWLASYSFGVPSYNLHLLFAHTAFDLAVADRLLAKSSVDGLKIKKAKKLTRMTPTLEEFQAIVADIRAQHCDGGKLILATYSHARAEHGKAMAALME